MQQVAARNCLHGAASGARAGVSVLEELFWNAAARSDAIAASLAAAACICMQIARVPSRARVGLGYVVSGTRRDAAVRTGNVQIDIDRAAKVAIVLAAELSCGARFLTKVQVRGAPGVAVSVQVCSRPRRRRSC